MITISSPKAKFRPHGNAQLGDADLYLYTQYMDIFLLVVSNDSQMGWRGMGTKDEIGEGKRKEERKSNTGEGKSEIKHGPASFY